MTTNLDKDIVEGFRQESNALLAELIDVVDRIEVSQGEFPSKLLEEFSQKIDRIMGAAKTLVVSFGAHPGLERIGKLSELCKALGYQAASKKVTALLPLFAAFWSETIEVIQELLGELEDSARSEQIAKSFSAVLQKRLEWLAAKVAAAPAPGQTAEGALDAKTAEAQIRELLKSLTSG